MDDSRGLTRSDCLSSMSARTVCASSFTSTTSTPPAHAHVTGRGREVRIGPNGHPIRNQPELSSQQKQVVEHYKAKIRTAVKKLGGRNLAAQKAEKERREAAANKNTCDT
jgi:ribosome-binding protein aMBF1 (putative translation factor)